MRVRYLLLVFLFLIIAKPITIFGEDQSVTSNGSVSFTGKWIGPEVNPKPPIGDTTNPNKNPTDTSKPSGRLPQTNGAEQGQFIWIGMILVAIGIGGYSYKQRQKNKKN